MRNRTPVGLDEKEEAEQGEEDHDEGATVMAADHGELLDVATGLCGLEPGGRLGLRCYAPPPVSALTLI